MAKSQTSSKRGSLKESDSVRLNKFLADAGVASRRKADQMIDEGLVKVNGKVAYEMGTKVNPKSDRVTVGGKTINTTSSDDKVYYMMNKPKNVLTSTTDPLERTTVMDLFKQKFRRNKKRVFPVGRLDWESEGMLLLSNDGQFSNAVMSPDEKIIKVYMVKLNGQPTDGQLEKLKNGVTIVGGRVKALHIARINKGSSSKDWIRITISEGKNRQVRKMFEKIGFDVVKLQRIQIGQLKLGKLPRGEIVELTSAQILKIFERKVLKNSTEHEKIPSRTYVRKGKKKASSTRPTNKKRSTRKKTRSSKR